MPSRYTTEPASGKRTQPKEGTGFGPSGECICPDCGRSFPHRRGVPCAKVICPRCGSAMVRKEPQENNSPAEDRRKGLFGDLLASGRGKGRSSE